MNFHTRQGVEKRTDLVKIVNKHFDQEPTWSTFHNHLGNCSHKQKSDRVSPIEYTNDEVTSLKCISSLNILKSAKKTNPICKMVHDPTKSAA